MEEKCSYCNKEMDKKKLTRDHMVAKTKGGSEEDFNMTWACRSCNSKKSNKDLSVFLKENNIRNFKKSVDMKPVEVPVVRNWGNSEYTKLVRINATHHKFLKELKMGRFSIAGKLSIIIEKYVKNEKRRASLPKM